MTVHGDFGCILDFLKCNTWKMQSSAGGLMRQIFVFNPINMFYLVGKNLPLNPLNFSQEIQRFWCFRVYKLSCSSFNHCFCRRCLNSMIFKFQKSSRFLLLETSIKFIIGKRSFFRKNISEYSAFLKRLKFHE